MRPTHYLRLKRINSQFVSAMFISGDASSVLATAAALSAS
jgi:hypothetical protein